MSKTCANCKYACASGYAYISCAWDGEAVSSENSCDKWEGDND